jgi:hypothetical protein
MADEFGMIANGEERLREELKELLVQIIAN